MTTVKRQTNSQKKASQKKVTKSYTTTSGVKVTKYSDGTEKRTGGSSSSSSGSSSSPKSSPVIQAVGGTREQQLANANAQMANIQKMMSDPSTKLTSAQSSSIASQLGTASAELAKIPKATAPTNAGAIPPPMGETTTTTTTPGLGDTTDSAAAYEASGAQLTQEQARIKNEQDRLAREQQNQKDNQPFLDKMLKTFNETSRAVNDSIEEQNRAFSDYLAQAESARAEIKTYNDKYAEVEAAMNEQIAKTNDAMGSMNFINNQVQQIQKNAAPQLTLLAAKSANASADLELLQGDYKMAEAHIQNAIENLTSLAKFEYDAAKDFYTINQDNFDRVESIYSESYKSLMEIKKQEYEQQVADKKTVGELILKYNADGAGIKMTDTVEEAYAKAGLATPAGEDFTLGENQVRFDSKGNVIARGTSSGGGGSGGGVVPTQYQKIVEMASSLFGAQEYDEKRAAIERAFAQGDTQTAYTLIENAVARNMEGQEQTKFNAARGDLRALTEVRNALVDYTSAGGDMGFLKGTWSDITRKLGQLKTDPEFARIATRLDASFQNYRMTMTGAAFGPSESRDYQKVNPSATSNIDLNLAVIEGLGDYLDGFVRSRVESRVNGASSLIGGTQTQESALTDDEAYEVYLATQK